MGLTPEERDKIKERARKWIENPKNRKKLRETAEKIEQSLKELREKRRIPEWMWHRRIM